MIQINVSKIRLALVALLLSLLTVVGGPASSVTAASPATEPAAVDVIGAHARIGKDGKVAVRLRSRCISTLQAFEMNVSVVQGSSYGSYFVMAPPNVQVCDGRWHTSRAKVAPLSGKFRKGVADVEVSIQYYDTVQGNDTSAGAGKQIRLCRR